MIKNLFILHTQYNLILGCAIVLNEYKDCRNDLILYPEFKVLDDYKERLSKVFSNVVYIRENFEKPTSGFVNEEKQLAKEYTIYTHSELKGVKYDNVFLSQERDFDCLVLGHSKKKNKDIKIHDIEEDCYYSINENLNDRNWAENVTLKESFKRSLRSIYRFIRYGVQEYRHYGKKFYGGAKFFNYHHVIYPTLTRPEIKNNVCNVSAKMIVDGCVALYRTEPTKIPTSKNYYLFFLIFSKDIKTRMQSKLL